MKQLVIIIFVLSNACYSYGQKDSLKTKFIYKNSAQVELGGHGLVYSLNYERILVNGQRFKTTGQVGFAYYPASNESDPCKYCVRNSRIPIVINEIFSFSKHHIELGVGYVFIRMPPGAYSVGSGGYFTGRLGYRYQKPNGHLIIRIGFTPIFRNYNFYPIGGLAIGYSFGK